MVRFSSLLSPFNENMQSSLVPGNLFVVDEIIFIWRGKSSLHYAEGMLHVTKIIREPEPVGCEMKAVACGVTGCSLGVEIVEDKFAMR